jgi:hypothetical protein
MKKYCIVCRKQISKWGKNHCRSCASKNYLKNNPRIGKNNPNYKDGRWLVKHYCKDCGKEVGVYSKQCRNCFRKSPPFDRGLSSNISKIRRSTRYTEWRKRVFERDNYTCKLCDKRGGFLHAHHIYAFADFPNLRFNIHNGVTLHRDCHNALEIVIRRNRHKISQFTRLTRGSV